MIDEVIFECLISTRFDFIMHLLSANDVSIPKSVMISIMILSPCQLSQKKVIKSEIPTREKRSITKKIDTNDPSDSTEKILERIFEGE